MSRQGASRICDVYVSICCSTQCASCRLCSGQVHNVSGLECLAWLRLAAIRALWILTGLHKLVKVYRSAVDQYLGTEVTKTHACEYAWGRFNSKQQSLATHSVLQKSSALPASVSAGHGFCLRFDLLHVSHCLALSNDGHAVQAMRKMLLPEC